MPLTNQDRWVAPFRLTGGTFFVAEPSVESPDVEPSDSQSIPLADSEPPSLPVEEPLEQAEQRLNFEAAEALTDSA